MTNFKAFFHTCQKICENSWDKKVMREVHTVTVVENHKKGAFWCFQKITKIDHFWQFWWTFLHSKCKRSSLRSQCWMRLFLWFSTTVHCVCAKNDVCIEFEGGKVSILLVNTDLHILWKTLYITHCNHFTTHTINSKCPISKIVKKLHLNS